MNAISKVRSSPSGPQEGEREFPFSEKDYKYLATLVYERTGIVLGDSKINMVYSRLARRLRELGLRTFGDYCKRLSGEGGDHEVGILINAITTNLTKFFRENHHFEHLRNEVVPEIVGRGSRRIRIWSAGCSSGEEPYSIAITLASALGNLQQFDARILATDLDTKMVATGSAGLYPPDTLQNIPKPIRAKYFEPVPDRDDGALVASSQIRSLITFKHLNLMGPWPMKGPFDAIFCRNVMIYFDTPTKTALVERFSHLLKPEGWLYIGHSESIQDCLSIFRLAGRTIYRKLPA